MKKVWSTVSPLRCQQEAENGNAEFIEAMVNFAEDKNPADHYRTTPLHVAAEEGNLEVFQLIFEKVKEKPDDGWTSDGLPLDYDGSTPLHDAASEGHLEICQLIIQSVKDKNPHDMFGNTPLHDAAQNNPNADMIRMLIDKGADIEARDKYQCTPLHEAAWHNQGMVRTLIERGASVNLLDIEQESPLYGAAFNENREAVIELCKAGAKPQLGENPLDASYFDDEVKKLIKENC